jgi:hypothetical protein
MIHEMNVLLQMLAVAPAPMAIFRLLDNLEGGRPWAGQR